MSTSSTGAAGRKIRRPTMAIGNAAGARAAIEHLTAAGHTRIGVVADWLSISTMAERLGAAEKALALAQAGLPRRPDLIKSGAHSVRDATAAVTAMLDGPEPPTAVFALNNRLVLGALGRSGHSGHSTAAPSRWS